MLYYRVTVGREYWFLLIKFPKLIVGTTIFKKCHWIITFTIGPVRPPFFELSFKYQLLICTFVWVSDLDSYFLSLSEFGWFVFTSTSLALSGFSFQPLFCFLSFSYNLSTSLFWCLLIQNFGWRIVTEAQSNQTPNFSRTQPNFLQLCR